MYVRFLPYLFWISILYDSLYFWLSFLISSPLIVPNAKHSSSDMFSSKCWARTPLCLLFKSRSLFWWDFANLNIFFQRLVFPHHLECVLNKGDFLRSFNKYPIPHHCYVLCLWLFFSLCLETISTLLPVMFVSRLSEVCFVMASNALAVDYVDYHFTGNCTF